MAKKKVKETTDSTNSTQNVSVVDFKFNSNKTSILKILIQTE